VVEPVHTQHHFSDEEYSHKGGDSNQCPFDAAIQSSHILFAMLLILFFEHLASEFAGEDRLIFDRKRVRFIVPYLSGGLISIFIGIPIVIVAM
jgi:hypothetical protein